MSNFVGKPEGKGALGIPEWGWENNIRIYIKNMS